MALASSPACSAALSHRPRRDCQISRSERSMRSMTYEHGFFVRYKSPHIHIRPGRLPFSRPACSLETESVSTISQCIIVKPTVFLTRLAIYQHLPTSLPLFARRAIILARSSGRDLSGNLDGRSTANVCTVTKIVTLMNSSLGEWAPSPTNLLSTSHLTRQKLIDIRINTAVC